MAGLQEYKCAIVTRYSFKGFFQSIGIKMDTQLGREKPDRFDIKV